MFWLLCRCRKMRAGRLHRVFFGYALGQNARTLRADEVGRINNHQEQRAIETAQRTSQSREAGA